MGEPVPLPTLVSGCAQVCDTLATTLSQLSYQVKASRANLAAIAAECITTKTALEGLGAFLRPGTISSRTSSNESLNDCFEVIVQAINSTILDIDFEIGRIRRYSDDQDPLTFMKLVPMLQDSFFNARHELRRNRSSLCLMLDCAERGTLETARVQADAPALASTEKATGPTRLRPRVAVSLYKESSRPDIQQTLTKLKSTSKFSWKMDSKLVRKLHEAIDNVNYTAVFKCLSNRADPNSLRWGGGPTPLHRALGKAEDALSRDDDIASRDLLSIITALILAGANLQTPNEQSRTPLIRAVKADMGDSLVSLMLEYRADPDAQDNEKNTPLHYAAMQNPSHELNNVDTIRTLLAFGADQSIKNARNRTALYKAVMYEHPGRATELLNYGADIEIADTNGWTPLFGAVLCGNIALTRLLCSRGANADRRDKNGMTALHHAVSQGHLEVVEVLVSEAGADVNLSSNKGETVLCRATARSHGGLQMQVASDTSSTKSNTTKNLVSYLLSHGADPTIPSPGYGGALPIHLAAMGKDTALLELLLNAGSPIAAHDSRGKTPLLWARETGKKEAIILLQRKGEELSRQVLRKRQSNADSGLGESLLDS